MGDKQWVQIQGRGLFDSQIYRAQVEKIGRRQDRTLSIEGRIQNISLERAYMPKVKGITNFDHRGHLIARRFGGPNSRHNLVPMHGLINQSGGLWYQMEEKIAESLGARPGQMKVIVQYYNEGDLERPTSFHIHVTNYSNVESFYRIYNYNPYLIDPTPRGT